MTTEIPTWAKYANIPFRLLGYGVLMGWHFLLIYFLATPEAIGPDLAVLFQRQIGLNIALAVAFAALFFANGKDALNTKLLTVPAVLILGGLGTAATAGAMYCAMASLHAAMIACTVVSGAAEALLIFSWLNFYSESSNNYATQYIAFSLVIGSFVAFFIRHLTLEVALACFVALPIISGGMLVTSIFQTPFRSAETGERGVADQEGAFPALAACTGNLAVYSGVFGFLQGSILPNGEPLLAAFTPNAVIGVGLAGLCVMWVHHKMPGKSAPETLRRLAALFFVAGVLCTAYPWPIAKELAGCAIMAGFMIVDIAALVFVIRLIRAYDIVPAYAIGLNRLVEYAAFAVFIVLGALSARTFGNQDIYPLVISGLATMVVLSYTMACAGQSKLDWINLLYPTAHEEHSRRCESDEAALAEAGEPQGGETAEQDDRPALGRFKTKCLIVCQRASLSPREIEVFMLMAKGRNAEYIQGALTISNYTAKTHIANIYRKCDVHSLQELIDAVEDAEPESAETPRVASPQVKPYS